MSNYSNLEEKSLNDFVKRASNTVCGLNVHLKESEKYNNKEIMQRN